MTAPVFSVTALLTVVAALSAPVTNRPLDAPVPPSASAPPVIVIATLSLIVRLLPVPVPEMVIVPAVPAVMFRSSALVGAATNGPAVPALSLSQKLFVPFHAPVTVEKPAVLPFTSQ